MDGIASVSHTFKFLDRWSLTADTGLGYATANYNEYYFMTDKDALNDWNSGLALSVNITDLIVLSTAIRYVDILDGNIEEGAIAVYGNDSKWVDKIAVTINF